MLDGLHVFENRAFSDDRGFFVEHWNQRRVEGEGFSLNFVQANHSRSKPAVIRGLHYQVGQGKLVGVVRGCIWDVAVDIRKGSPTYGEHFAIELSDSNHRQLWIPSGFAHGFCVLGHEPADVLYLVTDFYNPAAESGICWDDPDLKIPWPVPKDKAIVSARDQAQPKWSSFPGI